MCAGLKSAQGRACSGVSETSSWAPIAFILSNMPAPRRSRSPSIRSRGFLSGVTRTSQAPSSRTAAISSGFMDSFPGQKGQGPTCLPGGGLARRASTSTPRSGAMITQRRRIGSRRSSDTID